MISCKVNIKYTLVLGSNILLHDQKLQVDKIGLKVTMYNSIELLLVT